jgi:hypothetical protein
MTDDLEDRRTAKLLRALSDAWTAADEHLSGFDGGPEIAIAQSVDNWTDAEWAGLVVWVRGRQGQNVSDEVLDRIAKWQRLPRTPE